MTLVIALIGLALSLISLGWQIWSWLHNGPWVQVTSQHAYAAEIGGAVGPHLIAVRAINKGRAATTVTGFGLRSPSGGTIVSPNQPMQTHSLPHRLEPHSDATFYMLGSSVKETLQEQKIRPSDVRPYVTLGSGKSARGKPVNW